MKRFNKFLALFLVVVMAVGLLPATATAAEANSEVFFEEDFNNADSLPFSNGDISLGHVNYWGSGNATITDGAVKLTPTKHDRVGTSNWYLTDWGMGKVQFIIPGSRFEVNATYKVRAWFKSSHPKATGNHSTDVRATINVQHADASGNGATNIIAPTFFVGDEWTLVEYTFDMTEAFSARSIVFKIGSDYYLPQGATAETYMDYYLMVDEISIEKVPSNQVMSEGFEGWLAPDFTTAGTETSTGTNSKWNGASPADGWRMGSADGEMLVQPVKEDNGNVYMQLTTKARNASNLSRVKLIYLVPQTIFDKMEDGAEYIFSFDLKGDTELKANYEVKNIAEGATSWKSQDFAITSEWVTYSYTFKLNKAGKPAGITTMEAIVGLGWNGNTALDKKICIDNVSIVKVVPYLYSNIEDELAAGDAVLQDDVDGTGNDLVLKSGKTLDLNGKTLTVDSLSAMSDAKVIDTAGGGKLVVNDDNLTLQADNGYLPVKTNEGYIFVTVKDQHDPLVVEPDKLIYRTRPSLANVTSSTYLGDGAEDNALSIMIRLTWTNASNGTTTTMDVKCLDELVGDVYTNLESFELTVTGVDSVENLQVATVICSDTGVVVVGEALPYNALQ